MMPHFIRASLCRLPSLKLYANIVYKGIWIALHAEKQNGSKGTTALYLARFDIRVIAVAHMKSLAHFFLCEIKSLSRLNGEEPWLLA